MWRCDSRKVEVLYIVGEIGIGKRVHSIGLGGWGWCVVKFISRPGGNMLVTAGPSGNLDTIHPLNI